MCGYLFKNFLCYIDPDHPSIMIELKVYNDWGGGGGGLAFHLCGCLEFLECDSEMGHRWNVCSMG